MPEPARMLTIARPAPESRAVVLALLLLLPPGIASAVDDFNLSCPTATSEGETLECIVSFVGDAATDWPVVGVLHLSSDAARALVRGVPLDLDMAVPDGAKADGGLWWIGDVLVGFERFDLPGTARTRGERRTVSIAIRDDDDYEPAERFYVALAPSGSRGVGILYLNRQAIDVAGSGTPSGDAGLEVLKVAAGAKELSLGFEVDTLRYAVPVPYEAVELVVTAVAPRHARAAVAVAGVALGPEYGSPAVPLAVGTTEVPVRVTAEDGTPRTYMVAVTRAARTETVEARTGSFALSCPSRVEETEELNCTLVNGNAVAADWPVVAILHSSADARRALVTAASVMPVSSPSLRQDISFAAAQTPALESYHYGYGELFSGESRTVYTTYGYQSFDWGGKAAAGEKRAVTVRALADTLDEPGEVFYVAVAPSGYTGLSRLVENRVPVVIGSELCDIDVSGKGRGKGRSGQNGDIPGGRAAGRGCAAGLVAIGDRHRHVPRGERGGGTRGYPGENH